MVDIEPRILPECSRCGRPIKENETIVVSHRVRPQYRHVAIPYVMEPADIRFEVLPYVPELILCGHCFERIYRSSKTFRRRWHELYKPYRATPSGVRYTW